MDKYEKEILIQLQREGRMTNVQLAESLGLSESPTIRRVKQLEDRGLITQYVAVLDQRKLGLEVTAYVQVSMEAQPHGSHDAFYDHVNDEDHIIECHAMSGSHDFLLKVVARNMDHFSELCMDGILRYPGVRHVESAFSLKEIKHSRRLPVTTS